MFNLIKINDENFPTQKKKWNRCSIIGIYRQYIPRQESNYPETVSIEYEIWTEQKRDGFAIRCSVQMCLIKKNPQNIYRTVPTNDILEWCNSLLCITGQSVWTQMHMIFIKKKQQGNCAFEVKGVLKGKVHKRYFQAKT